ncbi:MAG: replicative DNA helicase [Candidatus Eremiobacteraeota bacterium]|nr:replicative DNA helicase [Candidatus Eremiobacteraeota bacterium]MBV8204191.1 replicative DNA helicase [Candidatus Eremiobacteraeota bacterium]MBV8263051.1 replicative DNA helicase [Candidatus Eremiobacteraeota bacterium]MBV8459482.1 replicative DNA helicase [Candidatus Eremiobacteraeota bacterium]MBV8595339.1 replicative DNA helicase [Candidatus Eremiobacteraeota bacterium]
MVMTALERVPPQNLEAEQAILGSLMVERDLVPVISEIVEKADFYAPHHATVYDAIISLYERGEPVDKVSVTEELRRRRLLEEVGGADFVSQLLNTVPTAASAEYYARVVAEKSILRSLITAGGRIATIGFEQPENVDDVVDRCEQMIFDIGRRSAGGFTLVRDLLKTAFERIDTLYHQKGTVTGVPSGFARLDQFTTGFQPGELIIIAARPSMGKTSLCLNMAMNAAKDAGKHVAVFSLEMSNDQLVQRFLSMEARIDAQALRTGNIKDKEWGEITRAMGVLAEVPVYVDDSAALTVGEVRSRSRRLAATTGLDLVIIDYLQLLRSTNARTTNRVEIIDEICRSLKALAKELRVPVIALAQLNRSPESRNDKRPMLSDLRESGGIEQEADVVAFIYRDEYYNPPTPENENIAEINIAKQRNGPTGLVQLRFDKRYTSFADLETQRTEP